jgi:large subunit ribosomal protein L24
VNIRTGDNVVIITGKDKGKTGQVLRVLQAKNRVVVTDINIRTRHMKANPNRAGEIVKYEASISASNVMLVDPKTKKRSRIGFKKEKGKKLRIFKQSGDEVKKTAIAKKKDAKDSKALEAAEKKTTKGAKVAEGAEVKKKKSTSATSETSVPSDTSKKSPFWKKMGFGADEMGVADGDSSSSTKDDHGGASDQTSSVRSSQRGS